MPTITVRITDTEMAALKAAASLEGQRVSDYVRETLSLRGNEDAIDGLNVRVEEMWRRLARLEEMAGL